MTSQRTRHFVQPARSRSARAYFAPAEAPAPYEPGTREVTAALAAAARSTPLPGALDGAVTFAGETALVAEDALYAAMGAVALGQLAAARQTLAALFDAQDEDGRLPSALRPTGGWHARVLTWLGRPDHALVEAEYEGGVVATALAIWLGAEYTEATGDRQFLQEHHAAFERAAAWLERQERGGLPSQDGAAPTMLAGVLVYRALRAMGEMAMPRGEAIAAARYWARAASLRERVNAAFWDAGRGCYREDGPGQANMLAVATGLAARGQALAILAAADDGLAVTAAPGFHALAAAREGEAPRARQAIEQDLRGTLDAATAGRLGLALAALKPAPAPTAHVVNG